MFLCLGNKPIIPVRNELKKTKYTSIFRRKVIKKNSKSLPGGVDYLWQVAELTVTMTLGTGLAYLAVTHSGTENTGGVRVEWPLSAVYSISTKL